MMDPRQVGMMKPGMATPGMAAPVAAPVGASAYQGPTPQPTGINLANQPFTQPLTQRDPTQIAGPSAAGSGPGAAAPGVGPLGYQRPVPPPHLQAGGVNHGELGQPWNLRFGGPQQFAKRRN